MFEVTELSSSRQLPEELPGEDPISAFFTWMLTAGICECVVICPRKGPWRTAALPKVVVTSTALERHRVSLEKAVRTGNDSVIGVAANVDKLTAFLSGFGYGVEGKGVYGSGEHGLLGEWNRETLGESVEIARRLSRNTLCVFAHDGDPIYLLSRVDSD